jgi:hypothetical protein
MLHQNRMGRCFRQQPVSSDALMIVLRNSKNAHRFVDTGAGLFRRSGTPTGRRALTNPQQLALQASQLSKRARELDPSTSERLAIQRLYGRVTACTKVSFAFQGVLAREVRDWLRRAEMAMTAHGHGMSSSDAARLGQMRHLIDSANAAVMRGFTSSRAWPDFCAVADRTAQSVELGTHAELPDRQWPEE